MALTAYLTQINDLLHNQSGTLFTSAELTRYVNSARRQIASEGACIRGLLPFSTLATQQSYYFINMPVTAGLGWGNILTVRQLYGANIISSRAWEWFATFYLNAGATGTIVSAWAQYLPGDKGSLFLYPTPSVNGSLTVDAILTVIDLVDDTTIEALPYPWTDAIKYYAVYLAFSGVSRNADSDRMFLLYQKHMQRARDMTVPSQLPRNFPLSSQLSGVPTNTQLLGQGGGKNGA